MQLTMRLLAGGLCLLLFSARGDVRLPALFSDHMVLQQGRSIPVWGWADDGEEVTVRFRGEVVRARARDKGWQLTLSKAKAGGPYTLVVEGKNRIELRDVFVGEVWLCGGQSNMEWPLSRAYQPAGDIAGSGNKRLRLFKVPRRRASEPEADVQANWEISGPSTTKDFSAVAFYFGRELERTRSTAIGLIDASCSGSPAEAWMSYSCLAANLEYRREILEKYDTAVASGQTPFWRPTELHNGMIAPLIPYAMRGVIWYQGESNADRPLQYRHLFPDLIRNWRYLWDQGDFAFLAVQLAPWDRGRGRTLEEIAAVPSESNWAELREAQLHATRLLPKVGLVVTTDVGAKDDLHPPRKREVGERLALAARAIAYGERLEYSGPVYRSMSVRNGKAVLSFRHAESGLEAKGGELTGFAIAGANRRFTWARAEVQGNTVVVSSADVAKPVAVRYGWADYPIVNLWNGAGLPACPFRTDNFAMVNGQSK